MFFAKLAEPEHVGCSRLKAHRAAERPVRRENG
jgi:hypothetical protein